MLTQLGEKPTAEPTKVLEVFPNPNPERDYHVKIDSPEFTCLCPKTGQPDFAEIKLDFIPDEFCVELKSLKLYYWSFRDEGHFHEKVTNMIASDLIEVMDPRYLKVTAVFNVRGGVYTTVEVEHHKAS
jgi:7-cyano-7-deazaguanine reductase